MERTGINPKMNPYKFSAVVVAIAALATSSLAQNAVGKWKGHLDMGAMPPATTPQAKQQQDTMMKMFKQIAFSLTISKDKSFSVEISGTPGSKPPPATKGTWTQAGKTVTLKGAPKAAGTQPPISGTISGDGKSLILMTPAGRGGPQGKIVFVRA